MRKSWVKKGLVVGIILLFVVSGTVYAKSLYVNKNLNANSPISAYDIQGPPNYLVYQMTSIPTRYGGAGLAIDTESEILFVTFETSGVLDIVDAKTLNKLGAVTAPSATNLAGIVVDQDKQKVYTVDRNTNHLYVYSWDSVNKILTNDVASSPYYISLPGIYYTGGGSYGLHGIALDEVHDLLYACDVTTTIKIFNTADWSPVGSFTVSQRAMGIAVDVKNGFVFTGNAYAPYGSLHLLSKYDLNTGIENTINIGSNNNVVGLAVDQDTGLVYITTGDQGSGGTDQIRVYDSNLNFLYATGDIGDPTGLAIPSEKTGIHPPDANPGGPYYGNINEPIQLFGGGTAANGEPPVAYEWTFDDKTISAEKNPLHTWSTAGQYIASLIVYDNKGLPSKPKECNVCVIEPFTFVHITDVHIGWSPEISGDLRLKRTKESVERFTEIVQTVNDMTLKPKFVMLTGDLVEWNNENFFNKFKDVLTTFDVPYYYLPGNHDRRTSLVAGDDNLENYHKYLKAHGAIDSYLISPDNYVFEKNDYLFIGLDSGKDYNEWIGQNFYDGTPESTGLTTQQINKLKELDSQKRKIIFMHNPAISSTNDWAWFPFSPVPPSEPGYNDACIAFNRGSFIEYCKNNNVQLVLTGHTHQDILFNDKGGAVDVYSNERPLFIQTRSATKDNYGFRCVKADAFGAIPLPSESPSKKEKIVIWADDFTIPILGVYDSQGRYTGVTNAGTTWNGIPDSYHIGDDDVIILFNTSEDYILNISYKDKPYDPQGIELFNLTIKIPSLTEISSTDTITFYNVTIYKNTTIKIFINSTKNYTMFIDYDGDNVYDEEKLPDSIKTDYAPTASIISPANNSIYLLGEEIAFNGTGVDVEDGMLTNSSLIWISNIDGNIGIGNRFNNSNLSEGTHIIELFVNDSSSQIATYNVTITIVGPDLKIDASNILFSKLSPVISENIIINATIYNLGTANASNISVRFFNGNPLNNTQIGENQSIESLNVSENKTVSVIWDTVGSAGDNDIWVVVDSSNNLKESDEENNYAYTSVFVGAPDLLHIMKAKTDRIAYLEGEAVLISCLVQNASGNIAASVTAYIEEPDGDMNQMTMIEGSIGNYSRTFSNTYVSGLYNITIVANQIGFTGDNEFFSFKILDTSSPSRITNLSNTTGSTWINWSWDKPKDADFDHVLVYLNGVWKDATSKSYYLAEELTPGAQYEIGILTVDKAGNINKRWVNQTTLIEGIIDNTPPFTIKTISSPKYGTNDIWITSNTTFNLSATDDFSGVDNLYYRIWYNNAWTLSTEYTSNFTLSGEGKHYLEYYAVDNAENIEETHNQTHFVDDTSPSTIKTVGTPKYGSNNLWVTSSTPFNLTASDTIDGSGVNTIKYRIWYNGGWTSWMNYISNFSLSGQGIHYLEYYSVDHLGNTETLHNQTHYVDDSLPVVTISASPNSLWPPNHQMKNVLISGSATDAGSGIASVTFTVVDEYDLVEPTITGFGQIIQLEAWRNGNDMDGRTYTITATATDYLGHVTTASTVVLVPHDQGN